MAITSYGYAGTVAPNDVWARMQYGLGRRYWVFDGNDCLVTPSTTEVRGVDVATGWMGAWGIVDRITSKETVQLPAVSTGTEYFLIVARRSWGTNQETTIEYTNVGTSVPTSLASHLERGTPGTDDDDQPLALVALGAGQTTVQVVYDLRVFGTGTGSGMWMTNEVPDGYYNALSGGSGVTGTEFRFPSGLVVRRGLTANGSGTWHKDPLVVISGPNRGNPLGVGGAGGWNTVSEFNCYGKKTGMHKEVYFEARRTPNGGNVQFTGEQGALEDMQVLQISNADWQPPRIIPCTFEYRSSSNATYGGHAYLNTNGNFIIVSG